MSDNQSFNIELASVILFAYFCACPVISANESVEANKNMALRLAGVLSDIYTETHDGVSKC